MAIPPDPALPALFTEAAHHYAMGWVVGTYYGQPILSYSGGTLGFGSEVAFLPEADLGVVILTNGGQAAGPFNYAVQFRLLELLFDQPTEFDAMLGQALETQAAEAAELSAQLETVDPEAVAPYLGRYEHPALGEVELVLREGRLVFDAGEVRSEMRPRVDETGQVAGYVLTDPPLGGGPVSILLQQGTDGRPEIVATVMGEAAETYVFTFLEPDVAATPTP